VIAESILRLPENSCDYEGNVILAGNVLTTEVLLELQQLMVNRTSVVQLFGNAGKTRDIRLEEVDLDPIEDCSHHKAKYYHP
jgi:hypothetical protein